MKKLLPINISFILAAIASAQHYSVKDLFGTWSDTIDFKSGDGYIFLPDSSWILISDGDMIGGKEWKDGKEKFSSTYSVNFKTNPMSIDLIIRNTRRNEKFLEILGIFEFINNETIKMRISSFGERPDEFNFPPGSDTQILTKVKDTKFSK